MIPYLILGLGNPGQRYQNTPHNVGFHVVDLLSERHGGRFRHRKNYYYSLISIEQRDVFLCKPDTYMNLSGQIFPSIFALSRTQKNAMLVITDNFDLEIGKLRLRRKGSSSQHKGLASISQALGDHNFLRFYLGVGTPSGDASEHVIGSISKELKDIYMQMYLKATDCAQMLLTQSIEEVMQVFNGKISPLT